MYKMYEVKATALDWSNNEIIEDDILIVPYKAAPGVVAVVAEDDGTVSAYGHDCTDEDDLLRQIAEYGEDLVYHAVSLDAAAQLAGWRVITGSWD